MRLALFAFTVAAVIIACAHVTIRTQDATLDAGIPVDAGADLAGIVDVCAGSDGGIGLASRLNAALASAQAVYCATSGIIDSTVTVPAGHALKFGQGVFALGPGVSILAQDGNDIGGAGPYSVILESPDGFVVFRSAQDALDGNGPGNVGVHIHDLQIRGTGAVHPFSASSSAIVLGNSSAVNIERVGIVDTHGIGLETGGSSASGHSAVGVTVSDSLFSGIAAVSLTAVNAQFEFTHNSFHRGGAAAPSGYNNITYVDIEPNTQTDRVSGIISNNEFHMEDAPPNLGINWPNVPTIGAIEVRNAWHAAQPILIIDNTITGGDGSAAHPCSDQPGIASYGAIGLSIISNHVLWMCARCVALNSIPAADGGYIGDGNEVIGNTVTGCGDAAIFVGSSGNRIINNIVNGGKQGTPSFAGTSSIVEWGSADGNKFLANQMFSPVYLNEAPIAPIAPRVTVSGASSQSYGNVYDGVQR